MAWEDISSDPEYQSLPQQRRDKIRLNYFTRRIAPNVPQEQHEEVRRDFIESTSKAEQAKAPSLLENIKSTALSPIEGSPIRSQISAGITKGASLYTARPTVPEPSGITERGARFVGESIGLAPAMLATGGLIDPLTSRIAGKIAPIAASKVPEFVMKLLPTIVKESAVGAAINPAALIGETRGEAIRHPGQLAAASAIGAGVGAGATIGIGGLTQFMRTRFPTIFKASDELRSGGLPAQQPRLPPAPAPEPITTPAFKREPFKSGTLAAETKLQQARAALQQARAAAEAGAYHPGEIPAEAPPPIVDPEMVAERLQTAKEFNVPSQAILTKAEQDLADRAGERMVMARTLTGRAKTALSPEEIAGLQPKIEAPESLVGKIESPIPDDLLEAVSRAEKDVMEARRAAWVASRPKIAPAKAQQANMASQQVPASGGPDPLKIVERRGGVNPALSEGFESDLKKVSVGLPKGVVNKSGKISAQAMVKILNESGFPVEDEQMLMEMLRARSTVGRVPAPQSGEAVAPAPGERDFAANVNLNKVDADDAVRQMIRQTAVEQAPMIEAQRRGKISFKQIAESLAPKVGLTAEQLMNMPKGTALNGEQLHIAEQILIRKTSDAVEAASAIQSGRNSTQDILRYEFAKAEQALIQASVSGAKAEAGRALSAQRMIKQALQSNDERVMSKVLDQLGGRAMTDAEIKALAMIDKSDPNSVYGFLRGLNKPAAGKRIFSNVINWVLSSPKTQIGNAISGLFTNALRITRRPIEAIIEVPMAAIEGRQREAYLREVIPSMVGAMRGIPDGIRRFLHIMRYGASPEDIIKFDMGKNAPGSVFENVSFRALSAVDAVAKSVAMRSERYAGAMREAIKEYRSGMISKSDIPKRASDFIASPTSAMEIAEERTAREITFTKEHTPKSIVGKMKSLLSWEVGGIQPLKFIQPFIDVPANVFYEGMSYSPGIGLVKALTKSGKERSEELAKNLIGSGIAAAAAAYLLEGKMWGKPPVGTSRADRDAWYRKHNIPYGIDIGGEAVAFDRIGEPLNIPIKIMADIHDSYLKDGKQPDKVRIMSAVTAFGRAMVDNSYTAGLSDLFDAIEDPGRYGTKFLQRIAQMAVPLSGAMRATAQAIDPTVRDIRTIGESVQSIIPGASKSLPSKKDLLGREIVREGGIVQPYRYASLGQDKYDNLITNLGIKISAPQSKLGDRRLSDGMMRSYEQERGNAVRGVLDMVMDQLKIDPDKPNTYAKVMVETLLKRAESDITDKYRVLAEVEALGLPADQGSVLPGLVKSKGYRMIPDDEERLKYLASLGIGGDQ